MQLRGSVREQKVAVHSTAPYGRQQQVGKGASQCSNILLTRKKQMLPNLVNSHINSIPRLKQPTNNLKL